MLQASTFIIDTKVKAYHKSNKSLRFFSGVQLTLKKLKEEGSKFTKNIFVFVATTDPAISFSCPLNRRQFLKYIVVKKEVYHNNGKAGSLLALK